MNRVMSNKFFLGLNLAGFLLCHTSLGYAHTVATRTHQPTYTPQGIGELFRNPYCSKVSLSISYLYIKPMSDDLKYATFVSGLQPLHQSWHYQAVDPDYHSSFDLGINYGMVQNPYSVGINWTHLYSNDSSSKQANRNTDLSTVEFVGPPFEMSPPVFGIKRVNANANFDFNNILLNVARAVDVYPGVSVRVFGGIDVLNLKHTMTTTFSDYAGALPTPYSYPLPPDPSFSFKLENNSRYIGAGPDVGINVRYETQSGFGLMGDFMGLLTVGNIQTQDTFTSTSNRLTVLGVGTAHQKITAPDATQVVFGADGKLGVFYHYCGKAIRNLTVEVGYRMATFLNAVSTVTPQTLVQPGTVFVTPEFATGTMAIVSTDARSRPFSFNGPFVTLNFDIT